MNEKRESPRFPWVVETRGRFLLPLGSPEQLPFILKGMSENIGKGGVCVLSDQLPSPNAVLRCEFALPGNPVLLPTLMKVRWSDKVDGKYHYRLGLQFLL
jgi:PilZ domain